MRDLIGRIVTALARSGPDYAGALDGFVDQLLQKFENCRAGLTEPMLQDPAQAERFFLDLYEKELPVLRETIRLQESHLPARSRDEYLSKVDSLARTVVIPAYSRVAARFTGKERNDFYLAPEPFHGLERVGWCVTGMLVGGFFIWAPFIPIWAREWVLPFAVGGFLFPNIRRFLEIRRYEGEINRLVSRTDREVMRVANGYLTTGAARLSAEEPGSGRPDGETEAERLERQARATAAAASARQGGE